MKITHTTVYLYNRIHGFSLLEIVNLKCNTTVEVNKLGKNMSMLNLNNAIHNKHQVTSGNYQLAFRWMGRILIIGFLRE